MQVSYEYDTTHYGRDAIERYQFRFDTDSGELQSIKLEGFEEKDGSIWTNADYRYVKRTDYPIENVPAEIREQVSETMLTAAEEV